MSIVALLDHLTRRASIAATLTGKFIVAGPPGTVTPTLRDEFEVHRPALHTLLWWNEPRARGILRAVEAKIATNRPPGWPGPFDARAWEDVEFRCEAAVLTRDMWALVRASREFLTLAAIEFKEWQSIVNGGRT